MKVSQIMSRDPETCWAHHTLEDVAQKMWELDVGFLPVTNVEGHVIGVITDRDACMAAYTQGRPLAAIRVDSAMARTVYSCLQTDRIAEVENVMREKRIRRMPVIDSEGHLVGVIAMNDIAREAARQMNKRAPAITTDEVIGTLSIVCEPRKARPAVVAA